MNFYIAYWSYLWMVKFSRMWMLFTNVAFIDIVTQSGNKNIMTWGVLIFCKTYFQFNQSLRKRSSGSSDRPSSDDIGSRRSYYTQETMSGILIKSSSSSTGFTTVLVLLSISTCVVLGGYPPSSYYPAKKYPYLPAPPGETPACAKHGSTFCEKIETYPTYVLNNFPF